jgi:4-hydroxy-2-oxoheptanedioate aldolase
MYINKAKQMMQAGQPALGSVCGTGSPLVARLMAQSGFDFILVDDQHGLWEPAALTAAFESILAAGAAPMARVQKNDFAQIGAMLDRGALGIVAPLVNSADDARAAAAAMRYPPAGARSYGPYGCTHFGPDYADWVNEQVFLAVQIESAQAVAHVDEILAVEGVDGCWIGPNDLGRSMGLDLRQPADVERHQAAMRTILAACRRAGKIPGIAFGPMPDLIAQGYLFVTPGSDFGLLTNGARALLDSLRG